MNNNFEIALTARWDWMTKRCLEKIGGFNRETLQAEQSAYAWVDLLAAHEATDCPGHYGLNPPILFRDAPELEERYTRTYAHYQKEKNENLKNQELESKLEAKRTHARDCILRGAWEDLDLPTPERLAADLLIGEVVRIDGHRLDYDELDGLTWITNPYGVDCGLCEIPTVPACKSFLTRIAMGGMYGPEP
ncbi:hypothetical protein [Pseudomonas viridiflava]|uniref:hypothetical protein n=1 Tax=Pseudomonas viridiflava TaxID=33069 RepID=UPI000F0570C5|nr:hypothetical protein [Pseudomonas viridiflava]